LRRILWPHGTESTWGTKETSTGCAALSSVVNDTAAKPSARRPLMVRVHAQRNGNPCAHAHHARTRTIPCTIPCRHVCAVGCVDACMRTRTMPARGPTRAHQSASRASSRACMYAPWVASPLACTVALTSLHGLPRIQARAANRPPPSQRWQSVAQVPGRATADPLSATADRLHACTHGPPCMRTACMHTRTHSIRTRTQRGGAEWRGRLGDLVQGGGCARGSSEGRAGAATAARRAAARDEQHAARQCCEPAGPARGRALRLCGVGGVLAEA
jgi:hypothetical protein